MNCKPDQLCRVISGPNAQAIVRTLHRCGCGSDRALSLFGDGMWSCEALQSLKADEFTKGGENVDTVPPGMEVCFADSELRPLGDEGPEDMTVSDELKKFADKETRKIIPLVWNPEEEKV